MTLRWPWTGRGRLDDALAQIVYLRAENAKLTETLTRLSRKEMGLSEEPHAPRPPMLEMPRQLADFIRGFADRSIQKSMRDVAYQRVARGATWQQVTQDAMTEDKEPR